MFSFPKIKTKLFYGIPNRSSVFFTIIIFDYALNSTVFSEMISDF